MMEILGIYPRHAFEKIDFVLLLIILIHRAIMKNFGLWILDSEKFDFGFYHVVKSDDKTSQILEGIVGLKEEQEDNEEDFDNNSITEQSEEVLIKAESKDEFMNFYRHELKTSENNQLTLRKTYKNPKEKMTAKIDTVEDHLGTKYLRLRQEKVELVLEPTEDYEHEKIEETLIIEQCEETCPLKYSQILLMSLKKYFFFDNEFAPKSNKKRIQKSHVDVYKYMFFCEFLNFFVLLFGFTEFSVNIISPSKNQ